MLLLSPDAMPVAVSDPAGGVIKNSNLRDEAMPLAARLPDGGVMRKPAPVIMVGTAPDTDKLPTDGVIK